MTQAFALKRIREISPSCGEDLGGTLARLANAEMERVAAIETASVVHWGPTVAQLFYLAAEAYEAGAAASIGHNRTDRYLQAARTHRASAEQLEAAAKAERDAHDRRRLTDAFLAGYADCAVERPPSRYAFDNREAWQLGQHFGQRGIPIPTDGVIKVYTPRPLGRDSERDHFVAGDCKYVVDYPTGKTSEVVISLID